MNKDICIDGLHHLRLALRVGIIPARPRPAARASAPPVVRKVHPQLRLLSAVDPHSQLEDVELADRAQKR